MQAKQNKYRLGRTPVEAGATVRFGLDVHADQITVVRQIEGQVSQPGQRLSWERAVGWIEEHVKAGAKVYTCYEAGPCGYGLHRQLEQLGVVNFVVAPQRLDRSGQRVKTDARDADELCGRLYQYLSGRRRALTVVRVPTPEQEQRRGLCRHRDTLVKERQRCVVRGCSLMLAQGIRVQGDWWQGKAWLQLQSTLPDWLKEQVGQWQSDAVRLDQQVERLTARIVSSEPPKVLIKGYGALTAAVVDAEIQDWGRFSARRQAASYTGLCPSENTSGNRRHQGCINRHGNPRVRHQLVEAVWRLLYWQRDYKPLHQVRQAQGSRARRRAVVAAARHLAIDLWRINTGRCTAEQLGLILAE